MAMPAKTYEMIKSEGKSHRTKAELEMRKAAEESLSTNVKMSASPEVRDDKVAVKEFRRIKKIFEKIGKDDSMFQMVINRYCTLHSECISLEKNRQKEQITLEKLQDDLEIMKSELESSDYIDYIKTISQMSKNVTAIDKSLQSKRKMMFDIEKENIMTVASTMRVIPKTIEKKTNPVLEIIKK